jgi:hypothetical protein
MWKIDFKDKALLLLAYQGIGEALVWVLEDKKKNAQRLELEKFCLEAIEVGDEDLFRQHYKVLRSQWSEWAKEFNILFPFPVERFKCGPEILYPQGGKESK